MAISISRFGAVILSVTVLSILPSPQGLAPPVTGMADIDPRARWARRRPILQCFSMNGMIIYYVFICIHMYSSY